MSKKREQTILAEIRRRVLAADMKRQDSQNQDEDASANREALADITSFSQEEVDRIADEVRREFEKKHRIQLLCLLALFGIIVLTAGGVYFFKIIHQPRLLLEENFDDNQRHWVIDDDFEYRRYFKDGKYVFHNNKEGWCYWDQVPINFPLHYTAELSSTWLNGKYDTYGFMLLQDNDNYCNFQLKGDGTASFTKHIGGKWTEKAIWIQGKVMRGDGQAVNSQRVEVNESHFSYFVNYGLIKKGDLSDLHIRNIGLRVCGEQNVSFDQLKILSPQNGDQQMTIFEDDFNNSDKGWAPRAKFLKKREIKEGKYYVNTNKSDYCYWSTYSLEFAKNFDVTLNSLWQSGEQDGFGFMLLEDDDNYLAFEVQQNSRARFIRHIKGKYQKISEYKTIRKSSPNRFLQRVEVRGDTFNYLVNDEAVESWHITGLKIKEIGLRVCGKQTVAFDQLKIISH